MAIDSDLFIYPVFLLDNSGTRKKHLGCAFTITPDGGLLTCEHVVGVKNLFGGDSLAIFDQLTKQHIPLPTPLLSRDPTVDLAYLPGTIPGKREFLPILEPDEFFPGLETFTYGFFALGGLPNDVEDGVFSGRVVNIKKIPSDPRGKNHQSLVLPYSVIEGLSGGPVLVDRHGTKLTGICYGNVEQRIEKSSDLIVEKDGKTTKESISRIVSFGLAYSGSTILDFLNDVGVKGHCRSRLPVHHIPGIESFGGGFIRP
jgi:hypothetical protein